MAPLAEGCAEGDDTMRGGHRQEHREDDDLWEMLHHGDERDLEE